MTTKGEENRDRALVFIRDYIADRGFSPVVREVAEAIGKSLAVTHYHLGVLVNEGRLLWEEGKQRTLRPVSK